MSTRKEPAARMDYHRKRKGKEREEEEQKQLRTAAALTPVFDEREEQEKTPGSANR